MKSIGPKIYSSNCIIGPTGGHADLRDVSRELPRDAREYDALMCVVEGIDECIEAVRKQLRVVAVVIKICTSGGLAARAIVPICNGSR